LFCCVALPPPETAPGTPPVGVAVFWDLFVLLFNSQKKRFNSQKKSFKSKNKSFNSKKKRSQKASEALLRAALLGAAPGVFTLLEVAAAALFEPSEPAEASLAGVFAAFLSGGWIKEQPCTSLQPAPFLHTRG
jgi:hypothetical protein